MTLTLTMNGRNVTIFEILSVNTTEASKGLRLLPRLSYN